MKKSKKEPETVVTGEVLHCIRYLRQHGIDSSNFDEKAKLLKLYDLPDYKIVKVGKDEFFKELAAGLRSLWPAGEKDGKWPWRESVKNLTERLKFLWKDRQLGEYSLEECLSVARRYLAQYENNTKYMMLLKYFVLKQKADIVSTDGSIHYSQESRFADMLEGKSDIDALENEWDRILEGTTAVEGDLI